MGSLRSQNLAELRTLQAELVPLAVEANGAGQEIIAAGMRRRAPKDTGNLASKVKKSKIRILKRSVRSGVYVATKYVIPVEFGSIHRAATPFVRPTRSQDWSATQGAMAAIMKKGEGS